MELEVQVAANEDPEQIVTEAKMAKKPQRSKRVCYAAKEKLTCTCTKVMWRFIQLGISIWQIADMVADGFTTTTFWYLSTVSICNTFKVSFKVIVEPSVVSIRLTKSLLPNSAHGLSMHQTSLPTSLPITLDVKF